jgi:hypothetical protein
MDFFLLFLPKQHQALTLIFLLLFASNQSKSIEIVNYFRVPFKYNLDLCLVLKTIAIARVLARASPIYL